MAEIHIEPKRRSWTPALTIILGLIVVGIVAWYFLYYRNG